MEAIETYEAGLTKIMLEGDGGVRGLLDISGLTLYGPRETPAIGRDPTFSFKLAGHEDRDVSKRLWDRHALAVGAEDYYSRVPRVYGVETMVRATFVHYNTRADALALLRAVNGLTVRRR